MTHVIFKPLARRDVEDIWDYTADRWGVDQANAYIRKLRTAVDGIPDAPNIGRECAYIRPGYRKLQSGSHIIFYTAAAAEIEIVRILHQSMDVLRHFGAGED